MSEPGSGHFYECEIAEDIEQQRRVWVCERVFWALWALLIAAALSGLLGHGALSQRSLAEAGTGLRIDYNRFERYQAETQLVVHVESDEGRAAPLRLNIGGDFLTSFQIVAIEPPPMDVTASSDHHTYTFNVADPAEPVSIIFHLMPIHFGSMETTLQLEGQAEQRYAQFLYP